MTERLSENHLPPGYSVHQPKTARDPDFNQLFIVTDDRLAFSEPSLRMLTLVSESEEWSEEIRSRLHTLADLKSSRLVRPIDYGIENTSQQLWFVSDQYSETLQSHFQQPTKLSPEIAWHVFSAILEGLADLHGVGLAHENLHPGNVVCTTSAKGILDAQSDVRIGGAVISPRPRWRKNENLADDYSVFYPTVADGKQKPTEKQRDLYALGILGCMLLLGPKAVRDASDRAIRDDDKPVWKKLSPLLKKCVTISEHSLKDCRWALLGKLLTGKPVDRLTDAPQARKKIPATHRRYRYALASVVSMILIAGCILAVSKSMELSRLPARKTDQDPKVLALEQKKQDLESEITALKKQNEDLRSTIASLGNEKVISAEKHWEKHQPGGPMTHQSLQAAVQAAVDSAPEELQTKFGSNVVIQLERIERLDPEPWTEDWSRGEARDPETKKLWNDLHQKPWDSQIRNRLEDRLKALKSATDYWVKWSDNQEMTWEDLEKQISKLPKADKETEMLILDRWRSQFSKREKWTLVLEKGNSSLGADYGTKRGFYIYNTNWVNKKIGVLTHKWKTFDKHDYAKETKVQVQWKVGQPIRLLLEGEGLVKNDMIDKYKAGPLSLWWFHYYKGVGHKWPKLGRCSLFFSLDNCPGPPRWSDWKPTRDPETDGGIIGGIIDIITD